MLSIVIRVLQSSLAASRSQLSRHLFDGPLTTMSSNNMIPIGGLTSDAEREELKNALIAAQESAALQVLLESCMETDEDCVSHRFLSASKCNFGGIKIIFFCRNQKPGSGLCGKFRV